MHTPSHPGGTSGHTANYAAHPGSGGKPKSDSGHPGGGGKSKSPGHPGVTAKTKKPGSTGTTGKGSPGTIGKDKNGGQKAKPQVGPGGKHGPRTKKPLTPLQKQQINQLLNRILNGVKNPLVQTALIRLINGEPLNPGQALAVRRFLISPDCTCTQDEAELVCQAVDAAEDDGGAGLLTVRYLRVRNDTREVLKVNVRFGVPGLDDRWLIYTLQPGESAVLSSADGLVAASWVRVWAESQTSVWDEFKDQDLVLVEEPYLGDEIETFTLPFSA
jgi:hypothetical protein